MRIFVDCGTHLGEGGSLIIKKLNIDSSWKIYSFEANSITYQHLIQNLIKSKLQKYNWMKWEKTELINKAVWITNGFINFSASELIIDEELKSDKEFQDFLAQHNELVANGDLLTNHQNSGLAIDGASTIFAKQQKKYLAKKGNSGQRSIQFAEPKKVPCIDFSYFLSNLSCAEQLVVKMDIERAEFKVLKKCIKDRTANKITELYVEWHDSGSLILKVQKKIIIYQLKKMGVKISNWM